MPLSPGCPIIINSFHYELYRSAHPFERLGRQPVPRDLVAYAVQKGAAAIALTDHDTVAGLPEALRAAEASRFELIPGLEISADYTGGGMHILGYFIDHTDSFFRQELERLQEARRERNPKIIARLQELGIPITYDQVLALSGGQIGRPHIAQAMLQIGCGSEPGRGIY